MTQQEAIEIIVREGLTHYHMDERETDEEIKTAFIGQRPRKFENEIVIREQEGVWHVYIINKKKGRVENPWDQYDKEGEAWDEFIRMLRWQKFIDGYEEPYRGRMSRQEVEKIMEQEELISGHYNMTRNPSYGNEYEIAIKEGQDGLWHVYKFGERAYLEWEKTYEEEEEAWGEFLYQIRSDYKWRMEIEEKREEEEGLSSLTREQAEDIILQEGLIHYNMDGDQEEREGDTVIRERPHWEVYEVTREGEKNEMKVAMFFQEEEAWGYLVKKLRYYNQQMRLRLLVQEQREGWTGRLLHHIEKRIKGGDLEREQEILCGLAYTMCEEEVTWIIDQEGLAGYSTDRSTIQSKPDLIVIEKPSRYEDFIYKNFWQIIEEEKENENVQRMACFSSQREAWRWLLERLREKSGRGENKIEGETSCYLSRKEAEEIIWREGLTHYNIDPEIKENPGDLVLRKCGHWEIYKIRKNGEKGLSYIRYNEREAWGLFIRKLKENVDNRNIQARKRKKEEDEKKKREAIKAHALPREKAEQILVQENLTGYNKNEPREDRTEEMVIREIGKNWEVYCTDSKGEVHGEKELFTVEEEAWGWFIKGVRDNAKIRESNRQLFGQDCLFAEIER